MTRYVCGMRTKIIWLIVPLAAACSKKNEQMERSTKDPFISKLVINEVVAEKSRTSGEFGEPADWFEVYNTGTEELILEEGEWFVTDEGSKKPKKFQLPETVIPAHTALVIWCDKVDDTSSGIHTNFALASNGEHIALYHEVDCVGSVIDELIYSKNGMPGPISARYPDGIGEWIIPKESTPGDANTSGLYVALD